MDSQNGKNGSRNINTRMQRGGANRELDVELGGCDLERGAEEHPGSVPQPSGPGFEGRIQSIKP